FAFHKLEGATRPPSRVWAGSPVPRDPSPDDGAARSWHRAARPDTMEWWGISPRYATAASPMTMNIQGKSCPMPLASAFHLLHPLHGVEPGAGTPLWLRWNLDPVLLLGIALVAAAYRYGIGPYRRQRGLPPVSGWRVAAFDAGTIVFALALISPLDTISDDYLFSAHMIQHMLIALVAPPLWLLGTPGWL